MGVALGECVEGRVMVPRRVGIGALAEEVFDEDGIGLAAGLPEGLGGHPLSLRFR